MPWELILAKKEKYLFQTAPFNTDINIHLFNLFGDCSTNANICQIQLPYVVGMSRHCICEYGILDKPLLG